MILYIHGFGSSGQGGKAREFREYFAGRGIPFVAPSLSCVPELAMGTLEELIVSYGEVSLIGSSLGGYYAISLAEKYGLNAVLINPAIHPYQTLTRALGQAEHYYDGSHFEWQHSHLEMLRSYEVTDTDRGKYMLLLQKDDEVLDYREAVAKLPAASMHIEEGGTHAFEGIGRYFGQIEGFLPQ